MDGRTIVVNEAVRADDEHRLIVVLDRVEVYDGQGRLVTTELRRHHLRWWRQAEFDEILRRVGFVEVRSDG